MSTIHSRTFQVVLFFGVPPRVPTDLPQVLSAPMPGVPALGLKLRAARQALQVPIQATTGLQLGTIPVVTYESGSGLWTVTLGQERLDVVFRSLGLEEITGEHVGASSVAQRLSGNLASLIHAGAWHVTRAAIVATIEISPDSTEQRAANYVAQTFCNNVVQQSVSKGTVPDLSVRLNVRELWPLTGYQSPVVVNRIRSLTAADGDHVPDGSRLVCQFDVNTAPGLLPANLSGEAFREFLRRGADWIAEQIDHLTEEYKC